jgi:hypothetical protein
MINPADLMSNGGSIAIPITGPQVVKAHLENASWRRARIPAASYLLLLSCIFISLELLTLA